MAIAVENSEAKPISHISPFSDGSGYIRFFFWSTLYSAWFTVAIFVLWGVVTKGETPEFGVIIFVLIYATLFSIGAAFIAGLAAFPVWVLLRQIFVAFNVDNKISAMFCGVPTLWVGAFVALNIPQILNHSTFYELKINPLAMIAIPITTVIGPLVIWKLYKKEEKLHEQ